MDVHPDRQFRPDRFGGLLLGRLDKLLGTYRFIGLPSRTVRGAGMGNAIGRIGAVLSPFWIAYLLTTPWGATGVYLVNGLICAAGALIVAFLAVETRGRSLEDISADVLEGSEAYAKK